MITYLIIISRYEELFWCHENQHNTCQGLWYKGTETEILLVTLNELENFKMKAFHLLFVSLAGLYLKTHKHTVEFISQVCSWAFNNPRGSFLNVLRGIFEQTIKTAQIKCCKTRTVFEQLKSKQASYKPPLETSFGPTKKYQIVFLAAESVPRLRMTDWAWLSDQTAQPWHTHKINLRLSIFCLVTENTAEAAAAYITSVTQVTAVTKELLRPDWFNWSYRGQLWVNYTVCTWL